MHNTTKYKLILILSSSILSTLILIGAFEAVSTILYYRWKANFDNSGWLGKVTIPSSDPVLLWEYRPYGKNEEIETNRYGFRDRDYESTKKPDHTYRVAFAGDSVTLGLGVSLEETFVRQLENEAAQMKLPYQVQSLNFAVDGYNTIQIYEMIRTKVVDFSPDTVVYVVCLNDFDFTESSGDKVRYFQKPESFFLVTLEKVYRRLMGIEYHQYYFNKNKDIVFQTILDMHDMLEQEGISFQVVIMPIFPDTFQNYHLEGEHNEIGEFLDENDIRFFDLLDVFVGSGESPRYFAPGIWHLNSVGHLFVAQRLALWLFADK